MDVLSKDLFVFQYDKIKSRLEAEFPGQLEFVSKILYDKQW